jgi:hypothetical protein
MKTITLDGADRDKWQSAAVRAGWQEVVERSPAHAANLKALFTSQ